jgi:fermentation-respiration switch protein FrsA (DUF1100 family)
MQMIVTGVAVVAGAWLAIVLVAWIFQRRMIYLPITGVVPPASAFFPDVEECSFETEDGVRLGGWFIPARGSSGGAAVLVFNGNAGDRSFRSPLATVLSRAGLSVMLFDYRGYGGNPGSPSEAGLIADARAARACLLSRPGVRADRIVYFGESLGCAVAVALAVEQPPAALVLRSPFASMVSLGRTHYPFLPVGLLLRDRFNSRRRVTRLSCPVLVLAGERDAIVPIGESEKLYDAASEPKRLVVIPGADHNDEALLIGERLIEETLEFIGETTEGESGLES